MPVVTLATMKTKLGFLLGDPNEDVYTAEKKRTAINLALDHIQDYFWQWEARILVGLTTFNTVPGTELYTQFTKDTRHVNKVTVTLDDGTERQLQPIKFTDVEEFDQQVTPSTQSPLYYWRQALDIGLKPTPQRVQQINLYQTIAEAELVADGDQFQMPNWARDAIIFKACSYCASMNSDLPMKQAFEADWNSIRAEKEVLLTRWQDQEPTQVKSLDIWESHLVVVG